MGKKILEPVFRNRRDLIDHTCDMIRKCLQTASPHGVTLSNFDSQIRCPDCAGGKTNFQWHLDLDGNQTTHVGMTAEGRKNKAVVSFAAEGTCSPLAFGAVIAYPTLCRTAPDKRAHLSATQDRLLSRANPQ